MSWRPINEAPMDGTQIVVPVSKDYFQVVSWRDGRWRENTNSLGLRDTPGVFMHIPGMGA